MSQLRNDYNVEVAKFIEDAKRSEPANGAIADIITDASGAGPPAPQSPYTVEERVNSEGHNVDEPGTADQAQELY